MRARTAEGVVETCGGHGDEADCYCAGFRWGWLAELLGWTEKGEEKRRGVGWWKGGEGGLRFFAISKMIRMRVMGEVE